MERRSFVKKTVLTGVAAAVMPTLKAMEPDQQSSGIEYYELRVYTLKNATQQNVVENFYKKAIPSFNKLGVKHVGVFTEMTPAGQTKIFVMLPYESLSHFSDVSNKLDHDVVFQKEGAPYLTAPAKEPAYDRIESSLMKAFAHAPKMVVPKKQPRLLELRQYQSPSEAAGKKKIEMFNDKGEIDIFKRLNFQPVFWGETIIGPLRPNLTYMVTFDDMAEKDAHWKSFGSDSQWKEISAVPEYADALLVNKITSTMLIPTAYSQI
jgi:hypothetical protein